MGLETAIYYHQFGHGGPPPLSMMNKWFTHYLHGIENDIEKNYITIQAPENFPITKFQF